MLKNKIIVKKIRNIVILLMALIVMMGAYTNIRRSRAENVIEITMEVADKDNILSMQTITAEATEADEGIFLLELPKSVNGNIVTKYQTSSGEEIVFDSENPEPTLQLTEEEVADQKIQIETTYDKKEVTVNEETGETKVLYNKELKNSENEEVIVTGYMPLDSQLETNEIDVSTLTDVKIPNEEQTMKKAYEISVFEEVEVGEGTESDDSEETAGEIENTDNAENAETPETDASTEGTTTDETTEEEISQTEDATAEESTTEGEESSQTEENTTEGEIAPQSEETIAKEKVQYDPSIYGEQLQVIIKYAKNEEVEEIITLYNLTEDDPETEEVEETQVTEVESTLENENIKFTSSGTLTKYIIAVEEVEKDTSGNIEIEDPNFDSATSATLPSTSYTTPYLPYEYKHVSGTDLSTGLVIESADGDRQFVWVEVPKTEEVYPTAGINITTFTDEELTKIENDLKTYTSTYRASGYTDTWNSNLGSAEEESVYYDNKKLMLKSIYKYGGFYIGRYETGIAQEDGYRTAATEYASQTAVIQKDAYPYNYVTIKQAQELAIEMSSSNWILGLLNDDVFEPEEYTADVMYGIQYDLVLRYLESKGTSQASLITDSTSWGNNAKSLFKITSTTAKYSLDTGATWSSTPYNKTATGRVFLTTGASSAFSKQNIYDLFGNVHELTLESNSSGYVSIRGGNYGNSDIYASYHGTPLASKPANDGIGFRVALYKTDAPGYVPGGYDDYASTEDILEEGFVVRDGDNNEFVWVEVPKTEEVYPTAGLNITKFTDAELTKIENDLHTYTTEYRKGTTNVDETVDPDTTVGLSATQYTTLKKKMLKSIYKYGGFYVGRYETGIADSYRTEASTTLETPVIQINAYPYTDVKAIQAQTLASSFATAGIKSSLMFGVQWDLMLKFMENSGTIEKSQLITNSKSIGNYSDNLYSITGSAAKYSTDRGDTYSWTPYTKATTGVHTMLTTGASDDFAVTNIYDFAGGESEWTLEQTNSNTDMTIFRGGNWDATGSAAAACRDSVSEVYTSSIIGFRVALWTDEDVTPPTNTSYEFKNVTKDGYDVYIYGVTDEESGVNRVQFPTWTDTNGQDDIQSSWSTSSAAAGTNQGNGTWYYRVNVSDHNNEEGWYNTHIYMYDNDPSENSKAVGGKVYVDRTAPTVSLGSTGSTTWAKSHNVTVTLSDNYSGFASGASVKYGWSTSSTTAPTSYTTASLNYTAGDTSTTFTATGSGYTGQYYLWVVADTLVDVQTNSASGTQKIAGPFYFDNTAPTISVNTTSCTWRNSALSVTITAADTGGSGLSSSNSYQYYLSNSSTALSGGTWTNYTSGTAISLNPGTSGTYYLFIKRINDNAGNTSTTNGTATTVSSVTYQRFGAYQFDYDLPVWTYVSKDIYYSTANDAGNDNYANKDRTVKIKFKGTDATSKITSSLTADKITVKVNGTAVGSKTLTTDSSADKEIIYTLTITGITGDGTLNVVIPAGTLTDAATNTNAKKTLTSNINIEIDNTNPNLSFAVTSPAAGWYKAGQEITITATYNENVYKEITSNNLIDTTAEAPTMALTFGGAAAKGTVTCSGVSGKVLTYKYTITSGDNGSMVIKSLGAVYDAAGNTVSASNVTPSVSIKADTTNPTITLGANENTTWAQEHSVTVTLADAHSGLAAGTSQSIKYGWSESTSTEPTSYTTVSLTNTAGAGSTTFTATGSGMTGKYYLWVVPTTFKDVVGNSNTTTIKSTGTFYFDNTIPVISSDVVQDHLIRNYDADNNTGSGHSNSTTTWTDLTGNNDGTLTGGTWSSENSPNDEYISLDGTDDWVNLGLIPSIVTNNAVTLETTIELNAIGSKMQVLSNYQSGGVAIAVNDSGKPYMGVYNSTTSSYVTAKSGTALTVGTKYHIVGVFDGTSVKIYVNGTLMKTTAYSGTFKNPTSTVMAIGTNPAGTSSESSFANLKMYSARIYDKALTDEEIAQNMSASIDNKTWAKTHTAIGMISDELSGLATGASLQYAWSTSNTTAPSFSTSATISSYTSGAANATFSTSGSGLTGKYYLWVKPVSTGYVTDVAGNSNTATVASSTRVYFDNTAPTVGTMTMKYGSSSGSDYSNGTWTNQSVYIAVNDGSDAHSGHKSTTYSVTKDGTAYSSDQTAAQTLTETGEYTITITTTDNAGNTATDTKTVKIDKLNPTPATMTMKYENASGSNYTNATWTNKSIYIALNNDAIDAHSGVKTTTYTVTKDGTAYSSNQTAAQTLTEDGKYAITVTTTDNAGNTATNTYYVYIDKILPTIKYQYNTSDIDTTGKSVKIVFSITDDYYSSGTLALSDLTIKIDEGDSTALDITNNTEVTKTFTSQAVTGTVDGVSKTIGYQYTLTLTGLEELDIDSGEKYADYSGVISVGIPAGKISDLAGNTNAAKTITMGIDLPDGTGSEVIADVVDPIIQKVSSSALAKQPTDAVNSSATTGTATLVFKATDKYLNTSSTLTSDKVEVYVDGTKTTSATVNITKNTLTQGTDTDYFEERTTNGTTSTVQIGVKYTITVSGWVQGAKQVQIRILKDAITDTSGNGNVEYGFNVYNCLQSTASETSSTSGFLGETSIARQDVEKVVFVDNMDGADATGVQSVWDVSMALDESILAWYSETEAPYTVYIGSDSEIFANMNSSYLFSCIGYGESCTETTTIQNLSLLNTSSVTNMSNMFQNCGYTAMTSLDLESKFDTSNVTDMNSMFSSCGYSKMTALNLGSKFDTTNVTGMNSMFLNCGYTAMTSLDLGSKFDTSNVTDMDAMFGSCGYTAMTSLDLGSKFDTSSVTNMGLMFYQCGYTAMTSLDLGDKFDTSNVTNMNSMFFSCGYKAMTSLDLGNKFDTSNVTNMNGMFLQCGYKAMTSLDLGDKFDTSNVTNMSNMFESCGFEVMTSLDLGDKFNTQNVTSMKEMFYMCGNSAMTVLDLGPAFTKIADTHDGFMTFCGTSDLVIYAPESIYLDRNSFK